jgi:hypothetical protein
VHRELQHVRADVQQQRGGGDGGVRVLGGDDVHRGADVRDERPVHGGVDADADADPDADPDADADADADPDAEREVRPGSGLGRGRRAQALGKEGSFWGRERGVRRSADVLGRSRGSREGAQVFFYTMRAGPGMRATVPVRVVAHSLNLLLAFTVVDAGLRSHRGQPASQASRPVPKI